MSRAKEAESFEYLIIGGGTAGSVLAFRLAEAGRSVCLLEAGPTDEGNEAVLNVGNWLDLLGSELDYDYAIEPQPRGNGRIRHSRARVLGGCSSHNSCIAFRTPDADFREWEQHGATGWGPDGVSSFYEKVFERVQPESVPDEHPLNRAFVDAAANLGLPEIQFGQSGELRSGAGLFQLNTHGDRRRSASVAYLHPLSQLPDTLHIQSQTRTRRLLFEGNRVIGAETDSGVFGASREVIVCCGAFDSPKLLLLSGIGPRWHLREIGIPLRVCLAGVGENLLDHPEGVLIYETNRTVPAPLRQGWEAGLFAITQPGTDRPDLMCHFGLQAFDMNTQPLGYPTAQNAFSITPNVMRAQSRGTVRLRSASPDDPPRIDFQYFTDPAGYDEEVMLAGVKLARKIAATEPLAGWVQREVAPGESMQGDRELSEYVRRTANTVYHPAGTCRMGDPKDPMTVVAPDLRVAGVGNLRIADASIFPRMISVNPGMTCMMIGEKCAELILRELEGR